MRLIDADKLLEETIKDRDYAEKNGFLDMYYERQVLIDRIKSQPTAYDVAINALEKQIPKKPTPIDYEKYMDIVKNALFLKGAYWCPNCNHVVKCGTYCSDCGQKLDWDE